MALQPIIHLGIIPTMNTYSPDVFVNGYSVLRDGDTYSGGVLYGRSTNIFVNGKPIIMVGDHANNYQLSEGSPDTFGGES